MKIVNHIFKTIVIFFLRVLAIISFFLFAVIARLGFKSDLLEIEEKILLGFLGFLLLLVGGLFLKIIKRLKQYTKDNKLDNRSPIVYFRSFKDDKKTSRSQNNKLFVKLLSPLFGSINNLNSEEEQLSRACGEFGPFIALSNPKKVFQNLGATKIKTENTEWQQKVIDLINKAQLVIIRVGVTSGLWWEVDTVLQRKNPENILFLLPNDPELYYDFKAEIEEKTEVVLPENYKPRNIYYQSFSAVLTFDSQWESSILYSKERVNSLLSNGTSKDFKKILKHVLDTSKDHNRFKHERSTPKRSFAAEIRLIGRLLFIVLIITAIITVIFEDQYGTAELESPKVLITWLSCSIIWYTFIKVREKIK
ncbi:hypothetical protein [Aquimarina litoralis]|uniref:hypothetical protein n=1 Tax=Aquimarina litoralis TaxID=584605 RepID=UPI001C59A44C|nr:hypothetical protein [Aquimarina litoralis]MBW1298122.1 hypothetical protein [Aquimarina litoralis]